MAEPLLRVEGVCKRFGGLTAVDGASLAVEAGWITALIGPNGAGKTTLFAIISGFLAPSEGRVFHRGTNITGTPPHLLARRGIARTFQLVQPFAGLTVHENIAIGAHLSRRSRADALEAAAAVARMVGLGDLLDRPAASLTAAGSKRLEVARALATEPELILLDEVLAGLNPAEVAAMVPMVRALADRGVTILMIEHVMQAVMSLAQHVFVLVEGRIVAEGAPPAVVGNPRVVEAYLGHGAAARLWGAAGADAGGGPTGGGPAGGGPAGGGDA
jgi:branched-chain amino acid transport system ATP-binding protein